ncbi:MAG: FkbM family methyltransferase [Acidobacteriaceae bacterium]
MRAGEALEQLLSEKLDGCRAREQAAFDEAAGSAKGLILFGAGGLGRKLLRRLRQDGVEPLAFIDNKLAGGEVDELPVLNPADAAQRWGASAVFVVSIWASWADTMQEQIESLHRLGCRTVLPFLPLLWKYPDLLPHVQIDLPSRVLEHREEIPRAFQLLSDEDSRIEFVAQLKWRLHGDFHALRPARPDQYWQKDLIRLPEQAVYVDAGACDGDTLEQFVSFVQGRFGGAYVFEPDADNFAALRKRMDRMPAAIAECVQALPFAVAEGKYDVSFSGGAGASSAAGAGPETVHCVALDEVIHERVDLIKYDIEGFELLGLKGSRRLIQECGPRLTVCAYHVQSHLWQIPLLIDSLRRGYRFYLRPHGQIWETVYYAVAN